MAVIKRVTGLPFRFGGVEHSGWLPPGATKPLPTPIQDVVLDIEIESDPSGFILYYRSRDGSISFDSWHQTLEGAEAFGLEYFGIEQDQWVSGSPA